MNSEKTKLRPLLRGFCIFLFIAGLFAVFLATFVEEPRPWKFQISGSCFTVLFGYFGITGKIPNWLQEKKN